MRGFHHRVPSNDDPTGWKGRALDAVRVVCTRAMARHPQDGGPLAWGLGEAPRSNATFRRFLRHITAPNRFLVDPLYEGTVWSVPSNCRTASASASAKAQGKSNSRFPGSSFPVLHGRLALLARAEAVPA